MTLSRSPMRRTKPDVGNPISGLPFATKPRACKACKKSFIPFKTMQVVCGPACAHKLVKLEKVAEKVADRARRQELKTIPQLIAEAQVEFNKFIRMRDQLAGHACISSGRPLDWSGNGVDAGHYRSRGAAPHLRFNELNCHAQSKYENQYRAGNVQGYRLGLMKRIGPGALARLEADNTPRKWTREELIAIKETYRAKWRALEKERA